MGIVELDVLNLIVTTVVGFIASGTCAALVRFANEQRAVNQANVLAQRSMQRDVIYRYFHKSVELGQALTPEEFKHVTDCASAYEANGGNGTGSVMYERIKAHAKITTGRMDEDD
jgi:hypothetical protein